LEKLHKTFLTLLLKVLHWVTLSILFQSEMRSRALVTQT